MTSSAIFQLLHIGRMRNGGRIDVDMNGFFVVEEFVFGRGSSLAKHLSNLILKSCFKQRVGVIYLEVARCLENSWAGFPLGRRRLIGAGRVGGTRTRAQFD